MHLPCCNQRIRYRMRAAFSRAETASTILAFLEPLVLGLIPEGNVDVFVRELAVKLRQRSWRIREFNFEHVCFAVPQPTLANTFVVLSALSTMRWVNPSLPEVVVRQARLLAFRIPKNFCDMREHIRTVFLGKRELLCSCHMTAPL